MAEGRIGAGRREAFRILSRVETGGAYASILLESMPVDQLDRRDVRLATELVLGTLRWRARLDHSLARVSSRPLTGLDPGVRTALRLAAYQILFLDRIPDAAAVNGSVGLARSAAGSGAARYVNGVLRSLCRNRERTGPEPAGGAEPDEWEALYSHPAWLVRRWVERFGVEEARALLEADNRPAPLALRVHPPGADRERLVRDLGEEGVDAIRSPVLDGALRVVRGNPFRTRPFRDGRFYGQDEASQIVPELLGQEPPGPVLDLCAAPGGKAFRIASAGSPPPLLIAADRHPGRLQRLRESRDRLRLDNVLLLAADFSRGSPLADRFGRVLLDAPCSGTGTLRRHPEIRWRLGAGDLPRLARLQAELLEAAAARVAPGGVLVYSVCSLEPEEGRERVDSFLAAHADFRLGDARGILPDRLRPLTGEGPCLETAPHRGGLDGFFAARLERRPL